MLQILPTRLRYRRFQFVLLRVQGAVPFRVISEMSLHRLTKSSIFETWCEALDESHTPDRQGVQPRLNFRISNLVVALRRRRLAGKATQTRGKGIPKRMRH